MRQNAQKLIRKQLTTDLDVVLHYLKGVLPSPSDDVLSQYPLLYGVINQYDFFCRQWMPYKEEDVNGMKVSDGTKETYTLGVIATGMYGTEVEVSWDDNEKTERSIYGIRSVLSYLNGGQWTEL